MFRCANSEVEDGHAFVEELLYNLVNLTSMSYLFAGFNNAGGRTKNRTSFTLYDVSPFIKSSNVTSAEGIFSSSSLRGSIDGNLFRPSIYSLSNI